MCPSGGLANFGTTVAKEPDRRGARRKPLKPLRAGTSGDSGVLVYSCAFYQCQAHTRLRVPRAPGVPHALFGRKVSCKASDASRREAAKACLMNTNAPRSEPSAPGKAGDPVLRDVSDGIEGPQRTGYPPSRV